LHPPPYHYHLQQQPIKQIITLQNPQQIQQLQQIQKSRTLPRPVSLIAQTNTRALKEDGLICMFQNNNSNNNNNHEQMKQVEQELEQHLQKKLTLHQKYNSMTMLTTTNTKPVVVMSSNDERGAPEGASSSPKHSSDLLFSKTVTSMSESKTIATTSTITSNITSTMTSTTTTTTITHQVTDVTKLENTKPHLVNNNNKLSNQSMTEDNAGVIFYSMNV
jgi:hypothetical protein